MTFRHLEEKISRGDETHTQRYLEVFDGLHDPTKTVLGYTLDIASFLDSSNLAGEYVVFGGYAVLSHLMAVLGEPIAKVWRGSDDIDMAGTKAALRSIRNGYEILSDRPSPNLDDKRTVKLVENEESECRIDFYTGNLFERFSPIVTNTHFGVPLKVSSPINLIHGKLKTPFEESVHTYDILSMLLVLQHKNYNPSDVVSEFDTYERKELYKRIRKGSRLLIEDRVGINPSKRYITDILNKLKKLKGIN